MKTKFVNVFAAFIAVAAFSLPAFGQDAKSLDELLQMIESSSISETADSRQREAAFKVINASMLSYSNKLRALKPLKNVVQTD